MSESRHGVAIGIRTTVVIRDLPSHQRSTSQRQYGSNGTYGNTVDRHGNYVPTGTAAWNANQVAMTRLPGRPHTGSRMPSDGRDDPQRLNYTRMGTAQRRIRWWYHTQATATVPPWYGWVRAIWRYTTAATMARRRFLVTEIVVLRGGRGLKTAVSLLGCGHRFLILPCSRPVTGTRLSALPVD